MDKREKYIQENIQEIILNLISKVWSDYCAELKKEPLPIVISYCFGMKFCPYIKHPMLNRWMLETYIFLKNHMKLDEAYRDFEELKDILRQIGMKFCPYVKHPMFTQI